MNAEKNLSFIEYVKDEFLSDLDTFRTLRPYPPGMFNDAIQKGITRPLRVYRRSSIESRKLTNISCSKIYQVDVSRDDRMPRRHVGQTRGMA